LKNMNKSHRLKIYVMTKNTFLKDYAQIKEKEKQRRFLLRLMKSPLPKKIKVRS